MKLCTPGQVLSEQWQRCLEIDRKLGWNTVPSGDFTIRRDAVKLYSKALVNATASACLETGAKTMVEHGANFRQILVYYYPNTELASLPR